MIVDDVPYKLVREWEADNYFLVSDMHFCHDRICELSNRPHGWESILIRNWNSVVDHDDTVFILGDACLDKNKYACCRNYLNLLNGRKILIRGNHDRFERGKLLEMYDFVLPYLMLRFVGAKGSINMFLNHYPVCEDDLNIIRERCNRHTHVIVHGHVHNNAPFFYVEDGIPRFNVSVDVTGFRPVRLSELIDILRRKRVVRL